jgi:lysozyme family protein
MDFERAFELLLGQEGEYSTDVADRGNWTSGVIGLGKLKGTKWGISAAAYPNLDIEALTKVEAKDIYRRDYWQAIKADELPPGLRFHVFDAAVNSGVKQAVIWLQRSVGAAVDTRLGPDTLARAQRENPALAAMRYSAERLLFMTSAAGWPTQGKGWARRIAHNLKLGVQ